MSNISSASRGAFNLLFKNLTPVGGDYYLKEYFRAPEVFFITNIQQISNKEINFKVIAKPPGSQDYAEEFKFFADTDPETDNINPIYVTIGLFTYYFHTDRINHVNTPENKLELIIAYIIPGIAHILSMWDIVTSLNRVTYNLIEHLHNRKRVYLLKSKA